MEYTQHTGNGHPEEGAKADSVEARVLIENSQVGAIIGKAGANSKRIREETGVFLSILKSEYRNVQERVLVLKGDVVSVGKSIAMVTSFISEAVAQKSGSDAVESSVKLLVHRSAVGAVIGKAGVVIKQTQSETGCRIQISQEPLPNSTDKTVTITGTKEAVDDAVVTVLNQLLENPLRAGVKEFQYVPGTAGVGMGMGMGMGQGMGQMGGPSPAGPMGQMVGYGLPGANMGMGLGGGLGLQNQQSGQFGQQNMPGMYGNQQQAIAQPQYGVSSLGVPPAQNTSTQKIAIPTVTAGCVIGKMGQTIKDIRMQSGTSISIADPDPATPTERVVTISGTAQGIQTAIFLIRNLVEHFQPPAAPY